MTLANGAFGSPQAKIAGQTLLVTALYKRILYFVKTPSLAIGV
jgi:hypothetical protein